MNPILAKYALYFPVTLMKGENIPWHLANAKRFQVLNREAVEQHQLTHLRRIMMHAYNNSDFYRQLYDDAGVSPAKLKSLADLSLFPCVTKMDLATRLDEIVTRRWRLTWSKKTTGGSTGRAVTIYKNASALARERAVTVRGYQWAGIDLGDPQARFWGVPISEANKVKYRLVDFLANRRRYSAFAVDDLALGKYYQDLKRFRPAYIYGYVSAVVDFARYVRRNSLPSLPSLRAIITTSEILSNGDRDFLAEALNVPVFNEYGCGEVGSIAHECERGRMHIMEDNLVVECSSGESPCGGELIVTDLFNHATPLIRYKLGDFGTLDDGFCECARKLKVLSNIHGRAYDQIVVPGGRRFHPEVVLYVFEEIKEKYDCIDQFQLIQESEDAVLLNIVPRSNYTEKLERIIESRLQQVLFPGLRARFEYVNSIPREPSGKLRLVKGCVTAR